MTDSSLDNSVERLLSRLQRSGLLSDLELSDEDIADTIWLACQMGVVEAKPKQTQATQTQPNLPIIEDSTGNITPVDSKPDEVINVYTEPTIEPELPTPSQTKSLPFQAPAAAAIQNTLQISRALRPLMKKVPSGTKTILDEEVTVTVIAEKRVFVPITKPEPERWLDLELIVEQSRSSFIWQETIDELRQILEIHGAFRSVRVWDLLSDDQNQLQLLRRKKGKRTSKRQHSYRELIHSDRRGLVLLVSDCVSSIWQQGEIHHWLQKWSQKQPTAIMQLFPERMWDSTQLGVGRKLFSSALNPGVTNPKLILQNLPAWIPINWQQALVLPVINLEPEILKQWSQVVAGSGKARISTYLFDLDFVAKQAKQEKTESEVKTENINSEKEREAEIIVKRFLATASMTAQRLAGMMAAAPVDMRVVNLIRKTLLPEATPVHVAEVYMGGILESKAEGELRVYQFRDGVRRLLNKAMARYQTEEVLDTISRYIAEEIDRPIRSFTALLALLPTYSKQEQGQILPFAQVAVEVLENLGGEYAEFAAEVTANINQTAKLEPEQEKSESETLPELETFTFDVATIEIKLEFKVVTLVSKAQVNNRPKLENIYFQENVFHEAFSRKDRYQSYQQLSRNEQEGIDYRICDRQNNSDVAIVAHHGGKIHPGSTEIADAIAGEDYAFYSFEGLKEGVENDRLHIPSHRFDEPCALDIVSKANRVIAIHGIADNNEIVYLGGLDSDFTEEIKQSLIKAGFTKINDVDQYFRGISPQNICNRGTTGKGVQIGISWGLRKKLFDSLKNEDSNEPTLWDRFVQAIRDSISPLEAAGWRCQTSKQLASFYTEQLGDGVILDMISIPGGSFWMGSPEKEGYDSEKPQHQVIIQPFFMGKFQVTQAQWQIVMENNPASFQDSPLNPVEGVSWDDAQEFCDRLSKLTEKEYRLPTEAEWEYACRARTTTPFHFGETISTEIANYDGNYTYGEGVKGDFRGQTNPVGYFQVANNFGLYDMHGNVLEWCEDDWHNSYKNAPTDGSAWLLDNSNLKVIRGGSWFSYPHYCRSAVRIDLIREYRDHNFGFRVVCVAPRTT